MFMTVRDTRLIEGCTLLEDEDEEVSTLRQRQHFIARSDKSVAYVTNNKRLCSTFCRLLLKLNSDRHEGSHDLFATAELLVLLMYFGLWRAAAFVSSPIHLLLLMWDTVSVSP